MNIEYLTDKLKTMIYVVFAVCFSILMVAGTLWLLYVLYWTCFIEPTAQLINNLAR